MLGICSFLTNMDGTDPPVPISKSRHQPLSGSQTAADQPLSICRAMTTRCTWLVPS